MGTKKTTEKTYELKYTGCLFDGESPVYLHYGTNNWADISETKMRKLKSCYKTEITVPSSIKSISFCFRDSNGNWDNNYGNDYWYTDAIGEEYSCVQVVEADVTPKVASTVAKKTSSTVKRAVKKDK